MTANTGLASGPAARSRLCTRRVTGRRMTLVSPTMSRIELRSSRSRCWTMCMTNSCSPRRSIGDTSAASTSARPPRKQARRQPGAPAGPASRRAARHATQVHRADDRHRRDHPGGERPRVVRRRGEDHGADCRNARADRDGPGATVARVRSRVLRRDPRARRPAGLRRVPGSAGRGAGRAVPGVPARPAVARRAASARAARCPRRVRRARPGAPPSPAPGRRWPMPGRRERS